MFERIGLVVLGFREWLHSGTLPAWVAPVLLVAGVVIGWIAHMDWRRSCEATELEEWLARMAGGEEQKP